MATALTTEQIVQKMYIGFYGRGADVDGLAYWVGKLGDNTDTTAIRESFSNSTESVTLFGGKTDTATVTAIYLQTFDRHPDASGLKFYKDALAANTMTKAEIAANIIDGAKGTDVAIVTNKLAVAELFTASMDTAVKKAAYAGDAAVIMARENLAKVDASTVVATFDFASSVNSMVTAAAAAAVAFDAAEVVYANAVTVYDNAVVTAAASTLAAATAATAATAPTSVVLLTTFQTAAAAAVTDAAAVTAAAAAVTAAAAELITIPLLTVSRFIDDETAVTANNSALSYAAAASIAATAANGVKTAADDALVAQSGTDAAATAEFDDAVVIHAAAVATYNAAVVTAAASKVAAATAATLATTAELSRASVTAATSAVTDASAVTAAAAAVTAAAVTLTTKSAATTFSSIDDATAATAAAAANIAATAASAGKTTSDTVLVTALACVVATDAFDAAVVIHAAAVATYDIAVVTAAASKTAAAAAVTAAAAATAANTFTLSVSTLSAATTALTDAAAVTASATAVTAAAATLTTKSESTLNTIDDTTAAAAVTAAATAATATATAAAAAVLVKTNAGAAVTAATAHNSATSLFNDFLAVNAVAVAAYDAAVVTAAASKTAAATAAGTVTSVANATASVTAAATAVTDAAAVTAAANAITPTAAALTTPSAATTLNTVDNTTAATAVTAAATAVTAAATAATAAATVKTTANAALVTALATAKTFSMTTGTDTFAGGIGDDTFTANILTLGTSDAATDATTTDNDTINITSNTGITEVQTVEITYAASETDILTINGYAVSFATGGNLAASTLALTNAVNAHADLTNRVSAVNTGGGFVTLNWLIDGNQAVSVDTTSAANANAVATTTEGTASVERGTTITKIENVNVKSLGDTTADMTNITGVKSFSTTGSTGAIIVDNASSATMFLGFSGQFNNTMTVNYASGLTGSDDNIAMNVTSAKNVTVDVDAGFERATLSLNGTANTVTSITTPKTGDMSLTIAGSGDAVFAANAFVSSSAFTVTNTAALKFGAIQTLDVKTFTATANTGGITGSTALATGNIYSTDTIDGDVKGLTMFLGSGNDNVLINEQAGSSKTNTIMLGGGNDIADIDNAGAGATYIFGEEGDDNIRVKSVALETTDTISGGTGTDTLTLTGNLANNLTLYSIENILLTNTSVGANTIGSSDTAVAIKAQVGTAALHTVLNLVALNSGSTVTTEAATSAHGTAATTGQAGAVSVGFAADEATSTINLVTGYTGALTLDNIINATVTVGKASTSSGSITMTSAATDLTLNASGAFSLGTNNIVSTDNLLDNVTVTGTKAVTYDDITGTGIKAVSVTAVGAVDVGDVVASLTALSTVSYTATGSSGAIISDNIGSATVTSLTVTESAATAVTQGNIDALNIAGVTITATNGSLTVGTITAADEAGTISLTSTGAQINGTANQVVVTATNGVSVNMTAATFIDQDGAGSGSLLVDNNAGDITATLSGAAVALVNYTVDDGTGSGVGHGSVDLTASSLTGGLTTVITNDEASGVGVSTVSLGAASADKTNSVTFVGYVGAIAATGSAGADTFVDGGTGVDGAASNVVNSSDNFAGSTGTDVLSYAGHVATDTNTLAANEDNTNGLAMNFGSATTTFYTGTNTASGGAVAGRTTLASGKVAQYDSGATGADATEKAILASGEVDTVSGFESVVGTSLNDYIISSAAGMTITGGAGDDVIIGGVGADTYIALTDVSSANGIDVVTINTVDGTAISGDIFNFTASAGFIGTTTEDIIIVNDTDVESGTNAFGTAGDNIIILTGDFAANASALSALTFDGFSGFDTGQVLVIYSSSVSADARIAVADVAAGGDISGAIDMVKLVGLNVVEASTGFGTTDFVLD